MAARGPHAAQKQPPSGPARKAEKNSENMLCQPVEIPTDLQCNTTHSQATSVQPTIQCTVVKMCLVLQQQSYDMTSKKHRSQPSNVKVTMKTVGLALP